MSEIDVFGATAYGELPDAYSLAVPDPFAALLANADSQFKYLIELYPFDVTLTTSMGNEAPFGAAAFGEFELPASTGDLSPVYLSNLGFTSNPDDSLPDQHFPACVDNPMQFEVSIMSGAVFGSSTPSFGSIVITNNDGILDNLLERQWSGRRVVVKAGAEGFTYDQFVTIFNGSANDIELDEETIRLTMRDNRIKTDQLLDPDTYEGSGGLEGSSSLNGAPKPLCFGQVKNIEPVLVDPTNLIYQVHDGVIASVGRVLDAGVALTDAGDVADITAASVSAGQYKTQLTGGYIKLGSTPSGRITADVNGDATGSYVNRVADIVQRILTQRLGPNSLSTSELDTDSFTALNTVISGAAGIYITDRVSGSDVIDALVNPCGAYWTFTRLGILTLGAAAEPGTETYSLDASEIDDRGVDVVEVIYPAWRISVGYMPIGVVQKEDELAGAATAADRALLSEAYRYVVDEDFSIRAKNSQAVELVFNTQLASSVDAEALLARLVTLFGKERRIYRVPLWGALFRIYIGDTVKLTYPRYQLEAGVNLKVVGVHEDIESGTTMLELWG